MSIHVGIFGPSLFGKTHVIRKLSEIYWRNERRKSLVLDPTTEPGQPHGFGPWCLVFQGEGEAPRERYYHACFHQYRDCAAFFDEGGEKERCKDMNPYFTRIRHRGHIFHFVSHAWTDALPKQRNQLGTLFLFWQSAQAAETIANEWSDPRLLEATRLPKYEFLYCKKFGANPSHIITRGKFPA